MEKIQVIMIFSNTIIIFLAANSFYYFNRLMKLVKVRRGAILATSGVLLLLGYIFFIMPRMAIGSSIPVMESIAHVLILVAFTILLYGISRIYMDWREVIK
ncbi:MAG: hypothetical protein U9O96_01615 [Candidatus Thermoplasmatota archaeon]|nr:hypothetical protein [Candidatus Thermoplasmatota archaeon]